MIAYLLGILPKGYTLSSLEAFQREGSLNVQAGTVFVDFEFTEEVSFHIPFFQEVQNGWVGQVGLWVKKVEAEMGTFLVRVKMGQVGLE